MFTDLWIIPSKYDDNDDFCSEALLKEMFWSHWKFVQC